MFNRQTQPRFATVFGSGMFSLLYFINPKNDSFQPVTAGKSRWATIEAARVLLNPDYQPHDLENINAGDNSDPIENHLGLAANARVPYAESNGGLDLLSKINNLVEGQVLIVSTEDFSEHCYLIIKKAGLNWLVDADRGIYKQVTDEASFIQKINGWEALIGDGANEINYLTLRFTNNDRAQGGEVRHLSVWTVSRANVDLLPMPVLLDAGGMRNQR